MNKKGEGDMKIFKGETACPGFVRARLVHSLDEEGIIVLDKLDANVFNLNKIKGLVIRNGGVLSHGAVLAREFNIPCVVGVDAPSLEKEVMVELNADKGEVRFFEKGEEGHFN